MPAMPDDVPDRPVGSGHSIDVPPSDAPAQDAPASDGVTPSDTAAPADGALSRLRALMGDAAPAQALPPDVSNDAPQTARSPSASGPSAIADFGFDLTAQARTTPPVFFGRDEEIETVLEALCRRRKANPLLLGPPGSGKTALVEAVAARLAAGGVPPALREHRIISISTGALVAGGSMVGEVEARMEVLLREARATGVILFFDEVHMLMGAGGKEGTGDVASLLKPALARGDIRCIAATTDDEFHRFIRNDAALERRFLPIRLRPLTADETRRILRMLRDTEVTDVAMDDSVIDTVVDLTDRILPNRHFPDKAIDLFDQVVARVRMRQLPEVSVGVVEEVAERMAGIPARPSVRLARLAETLRTGQWCDEDTIDAVTERLSVTLRGLDYQTERPNLVADVSADALDRLRGFARVLAAALYGDERRVLEIDGSTLGSEAALSSLVGASAGYIGYGNRHLLAALTEQPCHVVLMHRIDHVHPAVLQLLDQAIDSGWVSDQQGRRIAFSEAIVLRSHARTDRERPVLGFSARTDAAARADNATGSCADVRIVLTSGARARVALDQLAVRWFEQEGIHVEWSEDVLAWADASCSTDAEAARWVDREVAGPVWRLVQREQHGSAASAALSVRVERRDGQLALQVQGQLPDAPEV